MVDNKEKRSNYVCGVDRQDPVYDGSPTLFKGLKKDGFRCRGNGERDLRS